MKHSIAIVATMKETYFFYSNDNDDDHVNCCVVDAHPMAIYVLSHNNNIAKNKIPYNFAINFSSLQSFE